MYLVTHIYLLRANTVDMVCLIYEKEKLNKSRVN